MSPARTDDNTKSQYFIEAVEKDLFDFELLLKTDLKLTKAQRLAYLGSYASHAMLFTGVDVDANFTATKLHVDNSWGDAAGSLAMSMEWFREFVFYVAIDKTYLDPAVIDIFEHSKPIELNSWDTMAGLPTMCG